MAVAALPVLVLILSAWLGSTHLSPAWDQHSSNFSGFVFHLLCVSARSHKVVVLNQFSQGCFLLSAFTSCLLFGANLVLKLC